MSVAKSQDSETAVQKAARILDAIVTLDRPNLHDIATTVGLPKPSVHRMLMQLIRVGFVARELDERGFTVGRRLLKLSGTALASAAKRPSVRDLMREVVERTGESCNLSIFSDGWVEYLERLECNFPLRMQLQAGSRVPIHCTAAGKLFLAHMSEAARSRLLASLPLDRFTPNTLTNIKEIEAACAVIREKGISVNREEFQVGLIGIAVPIFGVTGDVVAAVAIHAPVFRMSVEVANGYVPLMKDVAGRIAAEFGQKA